MVTIKAACKVFLMDLTQVYKILRLYFGTFIIHIQTQTYLLQASL